MGVDFYCNETSFGCSYGRWGNIRKTIVWATINYLKDKIKQDEENYNENEIGEGTDYYSYVGSIKKLSNDLKTKYDINPTNRFNTDSTIEYLLTIVKSSGHYLNALIYFNVCGLFFLCNKNDCEGFYSPGNSLDICKLLDIIKEHVKKLDEEVYENIYNEDDKYETVYKLFKSSVTNLQNINIC
jgi:hypothetical protein